MASAPDRDSLKLAEMLSAALDKSISSKDAVMELEIPSARPPPDSLR